ncbi:hypothetical protein X801_08324, partial [Opisthorchis viverrini]
PLIFTRGVSSQSASTRSRVLALYRKIWRFAREWRSTSGSDVDTMKEAEYIRGEARTLFRQNAHLTDEQAIL